MDTDEAIREQKAAMDRTFDAARARVLPADLIGDQPHINDPAEPKGAWRARAARARACACVV